MEIPVINRISDLELSLQNPSMFSRVFSISGFEVIRFWKWGALVLALVTLFSTIMNRVRILIVKFQRASSAASEPLLKLVDDDDDDVYSSDDDTSSVSSSIEEEEEEEEEESPMDEDFRVAGSGRGYFGRSQGQSRNSKLWQRFSWTDLASGSVVELWDHLGLGLDFDGDLISVYDLNREQRVTSLLGGKSGVMAALALNSGSVVTAAEKGVSGNVSLKMWDTRVRCRIPEILAEWGPQLGKKIVAVRCGGIGKVHVRDDDSEVVGDIRNVTSPLVDLTVSDVDTWWDADAFIAPDELQ
ncbi:uncharacterized protein LOC142606589 [Castanea sativa]|uniref:uncharacterized protein LOC142606589 n=1 Tax=Castanea sativa TaxID=21020 RepID=UPI003F64F7C4